MATDTFPTDLRPFRVGRLGDPPIDQAIRVVRDGLSALGLFEAQSLPLGPSEGEQTIKLVNPLSAEEAYLRQSLLPGLGRAVETNWSRQVREIRLFEIGTAFQRGADGGRPQESIHVAGVLTGARYPRHWTEGGKASDLDLWDLKSLFEAAVALANPGAIVQVYAGEWLAKTGDGRVVAARRGRGSPRRLGRRQYSGSNWK